MLYGPMQLAVITFPNPDVPIDLRHQLKEVRDQGFIRVVDAVFVAKDEHADLLVLEGSDLEQDEAAFLGLMAKALFGYGAAGDAGIDAGIQAALEESERGVFGLDEDDMLEIADRIPLGSSALFVLLEHVWAKGLRESVANSQGTVVANGWITPSTLVAIGANADVSI